MRSVSQKTAKPVKKDTLGLKPCFRDRGVIIQKEGERLPVLPYSTATEKCVRMGAQISAIPT
jgi:hypothetical protein